MNVAELNRAIDREYQSIKRYEAERAPKQEELDRFLSEDLSTYRQSDVDDARLEVAKVDRRIDACRSHSENLKARLPDSGTVEEAKKKGKRLLKECKEASAGFHDSWTRFVDALHAAREPGKELNQARQDADNKINLLKDLTISTGIDIQIPERPAAEEHMAYLLSVWLQETTVGGPNPITERDLASLE